MNVSERKNNRIYFCPKEFGTLFSCKITVFDTVRENISITLLNRAQIYGFKLFSMLESDWSRFYWFFEKLVTVPIEINANHSEPYSMHDRMVSLTIYLEPFGKHLEIFLVVNVKTGNFTRQKCIKICREMSCSENAEQIQRHWDAQIVME